MKRCGKIADKESQQARLSMVTGNRQTELTNRESEKRGKRKAISLSKSSFESYRKEAC